ncbi:hypothetical protein HAX54_052075 [Datura stramonium]|uniref:SAGA-associated factor 11 n=1 Tax=Datura stramonium TaxID=4076 RepID=A0ABS8SZ51_DATST|nr:hypothetical protein [Datura stramonium]
MAGRFAPHLEKCMGKGVEGRLKATRSSTAQNRIHEEFASTYFLIQIPPAQVDQMEVLVFQVMNTRMAP